MITSAPYFLPHTAPMYVLQHSSLPNAFLILSVCFVFDDWVKNFCFVICTWVWDSQTVLGISTSSDILKNRIMSPSWATIHCQWPLSRKWSWEAICPIYDKFRLAQFCLGLLQKTTAVVNLCLSWPCHAQKEAFYCLFWDLPETGVEGGGQYRCPI